MRYFSGNGRNLLMDKMPGRVISRKKVTARYGIEAERSRP